MPHHLEFGSPELSLRALAEARPLAPEEEQRVACLVSSLFDAEAALVGSTVTFGKAYFSDPNIQAVTTSANRVVFAAGPYGPLQAHGDLTLAQIVGHEFGHIVQHRTLGPAAMAARWAADEQGMQDEADAYAALHVSQRSSNCLIKR
jgi:hypothetical protein